MTDDLLAVAHCSQLLKLVTDDLAPGADVLVGRHDDPVNAILETEQRYGCDLLVVGARVARSGYVDPCLAESVVRRARGSVLVTPLE